MSKKIFSIFIIIILVLLGLCGTVFAKDTYTATSTINGVTVNWSYELNDSNQIENLKCINPTDLIGNVIIPSTLDGKTVVTLGNSAFKSATKITEITIPNSVKEIGLEAFSGCTSLSNINLGNVERICDQSFKNCTSLTSIKLPKTLNKGASGAPFSGCENLKNIELEEGMTVVPDYVCASTPITEITIPNSVKEIGLWAFSGCTSLSNINLGNVERICDQSFKNCTSLTSIKLPKTLNKGASGAPFSGCENLKNIELEEGMTVVPDYVCASTPITEITIPNSVKEIGLWAFSGCTSLSNINLGNVERICDQSFKNCTSLTSIKLPKTLNKGASGAPFSGCENLKNIELEEGMTVVPDYVCASTPITEITIPNSVKKIGMWTFKNCTFLKKITILDNVTDMGGYNSSNTDLVFENHNDSLTVYCYKDSMAANYAIKYNIKYVYLTKPAIDNNEENKEDKKQNITKPAIDAKQEIPTIATGKLPQAGSSSVIIISIIAVMVILIINYKRYNSYKDIK